MQPSRTVPPGGDVLECLQLVRGWEPGILDSGKYVTGGSVRDAYGRTLAGNSLRDRFPNRDYARSLDEWIAQDSPTALFGANITEKRLGDHRRKNNLN